MIDQIPKIRARPQTGPRRTTPKVARQKRVAGSTRAELAADYRSGMSVTDVSIKYELHRTTVLVILDREGVDRRPNKAKLDPEAVRLAESLYLSGLSLKDVAATFAVNSSTVAATLRRSGVAIRPRRGWSAHS